MLSSGIRDAAPRPARLAREMGLAGLTATGVCSMVGAGINVIPFMIQRNVPGIGPFVLEAFAFAALPAVLAAIAYAVLASAMPRAGGSYVYVSRGLGPYLGFVASFSQWFALSVATGVVSYVFVPFVRDIAAGARLDRCRGVARHRMGAPDGVARGAVGGGRRSTCSASRSTSD